MSEETGVQKVKVLMKTFRIAFDLDPRMDYGGSFCL